MRRYADCLGHKMGVGVDEDLTMGVKVSDVVVFVGEGVSVDTGVVLVMGINVWA